jgi:WD40 repeat protein
MTVTHDASAEVATGDRRAHDTFRSSLQQFDATIPAAATTCVRVSPNGRFLAVGGDDAVVRVIDVKSWTVLAQCAAHTDSVTAVSWSPDSKQVVTVGADCALCVWNIYCE